MFDRFRKKDRKLDEVIEKLLAQMEEVDGNSEEYSKMTENLSKLYEAKSKATKWNISPDTLIVIGGNLVGILIILTYEERHIITSKAMKFVSQGRV